MALTNQFHRTEAQGSMYDVRRVATRGGGPASGLYGEPNNKCGYGGTTSEGIARWTGGGVAQGGTQGW
jgi:hypothetical protein